ncbi:GH36-type glycosyl hydrolase domain-containing protein [Pararhizobium haloflavum]|uniref:GH36-type glycosyl hydrolase domain-containing protein n=1 Tax=Pararhizobium haloflavum TaxID=2037914 RepID=UPI000C1A11ED|nr:glucoamylase family protein [Pararhizobium haloflavum]
MNFQDKTPSRYPQAAESEAKSRGVASGRRVHRLSTQANKSDSIRATYLSDQEIEIAGRELAEGKIRALPEFKTFDIIARQKENETAILNAYRSTRDANEVGEMITPAAEWLLDNHYLVEQNIRQVRRDLPLKFYRQLPTLAMSETGELPQALALAWLYVAHTHSSLTLHSLTAMVEGFQTRKVLKIGEIWALPSILRFVLIENLSRISQRVENARNMRRLANMVADRIQKLASGESCTPILIENEHYTHDNAFAAQLLYRLRDGSDIAEEAIAWLEAKLEARGMDAEEVLVLEHNRLSSGNATMGAIIRSLRKIDDTDWTVWFESISRVDQVLRERSTFAQLDFQSRDVYREAVERLARRAGCEETHVAETAIAMAGGVSGTQSGVDAGRVLVGPLRHDLEKAIDYKPSLRDRIWRITRRFGWRSIAVPTLLLIPIFLFVGYWLLSAMGVSAAVSLPLLFFFLFPASEAATGLYNTTISLTVRPTRLIGYEFKDGIPEEARTLLVVPCLIGSRDGVDDLLRNLEVHYLANTAGEISFALLSDWADSENEETEADRDLLDYAQREVNALADRYAFDGRTRFFLLHRRRLFNPSEGVWMGWERKRGKLHELNLLLRGDQDTTYLPLDRPLPDDIRYVMTLDSDTRLTRDAVTKLAGKLAHPLNSPVLDKDGRVVSGYAILQPRVTPSLTTGHEASAFQRIFSVNRGLDPYVFTVSDVYQDIAEEGSFTGKGLYHVDAFEAALAGRLPENAVLSHDLLEGSFARSALVSDVELVEDFPVRYQVESSRQHRWARGDWQLLPFILGWQERVSALGRWKMFDNLRRSLTPIFWLIGSVLGWSLLPLQPAIIWQMTMILSLFVAPTLGLIAGAIPRRTDIIPRAHLQSVIEEFASATAQVVLRIVFIAHTAWNMGDAIARSFYRLFVSHRKMLEWRTAASAHGSASVDLASFYRAMWQAPAIALVALTVPFLFFGNGGELVAIPFSLLWALSPAVAWFVSQSAETEDRLVVTEHDRLELRKVARRTWHYFESFVTAEHNHLPPDNFQETPVPIVAGRTSPTNIGIYLLSIVSARDFGWISLEEAVSRLEQTTATIGRMESHRGHLYNWYDTRTLQPLMPQYVSSVDSGNLAGHLIAVSSACREWADAPAAFLQGSIEGIDDVAAVVAETFALVADDRRTVRPLRHRLDERIQGFRRALAKLRHEPEFASIRTINLTVLAREIEKLSGDLHEEIDSVESGDLTHWARSLTRTCEAHVADAVFDPHHVEALRTRLAALRERTRDIAFSMDFRFLLRADRRLLSIGYRVTERELDESCYDLLASEARLTSLFGIAKGDLPTEHWFRLGRPIVPVGAHGALMSWSGSMFEYLMPPLVMQERQGGILNQTNNLIVRRQMEYGASLGVPWGISEAAFNARDPEMTYQYSNFGVPSLGLKRGLGENAVVAPYATVLASQYRPRDAVANLTKLRALGALGRYGYYDAVDFTPSRVPEKQTYAVVRNYMAHHHGMSIAAIANVVFSGRLRDLFHSDPVIEAAELLLQEKAPRDVPVITIKHDEKLSSKGPAELRRPELRIVRDPLHAERMTSLMSNGHYSTMLTATGSGYARWNGLSVTRWKPDPTEDRWGSFVFLRDQRSGDWWSATAEPKQAEGEETLTIFADDKAEFYKTVGDIRSELECIVGVESDAEARRLTIFNNGTEDRFIEVTSYAEVVIAADDADAAHPAFSKMFVKTEIGPKGDVIFAERKKRAPNDPDMHVAHLIVDSSNLSRDTQAETDRRAFIGRGRNLSDAAAFDADAKLSGSQGFTMDPILSLRRVVRVPAGKKSRVIFWTLAAPSRHEIEDAVLRYRHAESFNHEMMQAWTRSQVQTRHVGISSQEAADFQRLARYLIYPDLQLRSGTESFSAGLTKQSALWPLAISGDYPICALRINDEADQEIVKKALLAQEYLRARGLVADLVIVNERATSYAQDMQRSIETMCENARLRGTAEGPRQHIFAVRRDLMEPTTYDALMAASRIVLHARNGKLSTQIDRVSHEPPASAVTVPRAKSERIAEEGRPVPSPRARPVATNSGASRAIQPVPPAVAAIDGEGLRFFNGYGGFEGARSDYVVRLHGGAATPHPWINVVSNGDFGFHISAEGCGFSWSRNSRDYQLTPWSNDPVENRPGEAFFIADRETSAVFTPFAALSRDRNQVFEARHGQGFSCFKTKSADGLDMELTQVVDPDNPVKLSRLVIANDGTQTRRLRVYGYAEWVLGNNRSKSAPFVVPAFDSASGVLSAANPYSIDYADRVAFMSCSEAAVSFTSSRREFLGRNGSIYHPSAVYAGKVLSGMTEPDGDPCAAISTDLDIAPGEKREIVFLLGDVGQLAEATALAQRDGSETFKRCLERTEVEWDDFLDTLQVETPDDAMNIMVNRWLPYQSLACRIRARSAFYQASGAFGFRDQLQDTLALMLHDPALARDQILNAARRQFTEGDVQHWWLPASGAGVRTMISDDVVWLVYGVTQYLAATGDVDILDVSLPFIEGDPLGEGQHDSFFEPRVSGETAQLYEHCARALQLAVERTGPHGLPLILGGDWNDGMNRVGEDGRGESVWLGWFLLSAIDAFKPLAAQRHDGRLAGWEAHAGKLKSALEEAGWDGAYYRRGYFDDGTPLGSAANSECRIDSIAQSWSVLSGHGDPSRTTQAMDAVLDQLVDEDAQIVRLFTPPFENTDKEPGYIKGYPPGVRENGGQYTHAATWVVYALARMDRGDDAHRCFDMLNPISHARTRDAAERYRVEPYVVAADVYSGEERDGRGGWTWYTGSGGWLYRAAVEAILGIRRQGDRVMIEPCLPSAWDGYTARLVLEGRRREIVVERADEGYRVRVDGNLLEDGVLAISAGHATKSP